MQGAQILEAPSLGTMVKTENKEVVVVPSLAVLADKPYVSAAPLLGVGSPFIFPLPLVLNHWPGEMNLLPDLHRPLSDKLRYC